MRTSAIAMVSLAGCSLTTPLDQHGSGNGSAAATESNASSGTAGVSTSGAGAATGSGYASEVLADEPLAYWRLGEMRGPTAFDSAAGGLDGTYAGAVQYGGSGVLSGDPDTAVIFDGATAYVSIGNAAPLGFLDTMPFTLEAWIKLSSEPVNTNAICGRWTTGANGNGYLFFVTQDGLSLRRWGTASASHALAPLSAVGLFTHVVATYDGIMLRVYVNGVEGDPDQARDAMPDHSALFVIGATVGGDVEDDHFAGTLDEVAVYDRALPESRIVAHHAAAMQP